MANTQESSAVIFLAKAQRAQSFLMCFYLHEIEFCFFFAALAPLRDLINVYSSSDIGIHLSILNFPDFR